VGTGLICAIIWYPPRDHNPSGGLRLCSIGGSLSGVIGDGWRTEPDSIRPVKRIGVSISQRSAPAGEWRTHFHVPLHFPGAGGLVSTADLLDRDFLAAAAAPGRHLEIKAYTFDLLPGSRADVVDAVVGEFDWLGDR